MDKKLYNKMIDNLYKISQSEIKIITKLTGPNKLGFSLAKSILIRLRITFAAIRTLIKKNYNIEVMILVRFVQEQISYRYCLYELE